MATRRASGSTNMFVALTTLLLIFTCIFAVYLVVGAIFGAVNGGREVPAHQEVPVGQLDSLPRSSVTISDPVPVTIRIRDAEPHQLLLATLRDLMVVALAVSILWLVRRLLLSVRAGDPFAVANVRRLRAISYVVIFGYPISVFITQRIEAALAASSTVGEFQSSFPGNVDGAVVVGLIVLVLAEVFAHGVRLSEDVEGTV